MRQTEMWQQQLVQERMRADRERGRFVEKVEFDKKKCFLEITARIPNMVANNLSFGARSESSWVYASPPKENATAARGNTRASKEYAASKGKSMFSFIYCEPNADVPGSGFTKKGLQANDYDEKMYLKGSPLKILPLGVLGGVFAPCDSYRYTIHIQVYMYILFIRYIYIYIYIHLGFDLQVCWSLGLEF